MLLIYHAYRQGNSEKRKREMPEIAVFYKKVESKVNKSSVHLDGERISAKAQRVLEKF